MKCIAILTAAYPYYPGEQFIEDEIVFWATQRSIKLILIPMNARGTPRNIPNSIEIDLTLSNSNSIANKIFYIFKSLISNIFWREVKYIFSSKKKKKSTCILEALFSTSRVLRIENSLLKVCSRHHKIDVMYGYWNEAQTYAAVLLKKNGIISSVVSRAHGWDLYQERRENSYMPLKKQFACDMNVIYAISSAGKKYLEEIYEIASEKISISRLGVPIPKILCKAGPHDTVSIVSISHCNENKRIDKIIRALELVSKQLINKRIKWVHIGDGPLLAKLKSLAEEVLIAENIEHCFLGLISNSEVKKYFEQNMIDMIINSSDSEGLPVTLMEAMSYGVPAIAPNIGGISEIINVENGVLLAKMPSSQMIAEGILYLCQSKNKMAMRLAAQRIVGERFNASINYPALIKLIDTSN